MWARVVHDHLVGEYLLPVCLDGGVPVLPQDTLPELLEDVLRQGEAPFAWSARFADLLPFDFYLRGHIKRLVNETPADIVKELVARIVAAGEVT
ncbi:hypothetical protein PR048_012049 [Dryococelus australis]|uniref:Uncharacterized protein n=1 Tax=Dryococelus australis TaxID=614101 RepID=A0ABQ9HNB8_9NEOP|nr:hypothetical protein PR048_012049 [Dryococelus australis]